jgi:Zn-dependent protease
MALDAVSMPSACLPCYDDSATDIFLNKTRAARVFFEPNETPYDLRWRMLGTDVRVHPWFWLMSVLMGWSALREGFAYLLVWVVCVFVSILIHEFGHVLMGRLFGTRGHIVLYSFGGLAIGSSALRNRWQRIAVYLAGPTAGFVLFGLVWLAVRYANLKDVPPLVLDAIDDLFWINLFWGAMNLLPVWPLDGGQASRDFLDWLIPDKGIRAALGISMVTAGFLAVNSLTASYGRPLIPFLSIGDIYFTILFGALAFASYQALQLETKRSPWHRTDDYWR